MTTIQALAAYPELQRFELESRPAPGLPPGGALIRTLACGLCGTDNEKLQGAKVPAGSILGHEVVGLIEALSADAPAQWQLGQRVVVTHHVPCGNCHYCLNHSPSMCRYFKATNLEPGGFSEVFAVSEDHLKQTTFAVPSHISNREAVCLEPLGCVIRAVNRVAPAGAHNGSVAVVGMGFIGLLAAQVFQRRGFKVLGIDKLTERLFLAQQSGYIASGWQAGGNEAPLTEFLDHATATQKVDVVCLTVASLSAWAMALTLVRDGGSILLLASAPEDARLDPSPFYYREISLIPSYSPSLEALREAADLLFTRQISTTPLMTHPMRVEQANEGLAAYRNREAIKVLYEF